MMEACKRMYIYTEFVSSFKTHAYLIYLLSFMFLWSVSLAEFKCGRCNQVFKNEYPYLAHCRFLCTQVKSDTWSREVYEHKHVEIRRQRRVTDFHNIARDLEHKKAGSNEDTDIPKKRKYEETSYFKGRKTVLLEKTNISNDGNITQMTRGHDQAAGDASVSTGKLKADGIKPDHLGCKKDAFGEVGEPKGTFTHEREMDTESDRGESSGVRSSSRSAFSPVLSNSQSEQKSAFCKPSKITSLSDPPAHLSSVTTAPSSRLEEMTDAFTSRTVMGYNNLFASNILSSDLQTVPPTVTLNSAFHYAPEHWSRNIGSQLQTTSSLTILPPTFTSFGVSVQNWCAKCNLSFRMTSDLVFHMRSHHKKEFAAESQVRRRREEKLTCPICHEYFRERHHLSRHMTSHNWDDKGQKKTKLYLFPKWCVERLYLTDLDSQTL